MRDKGKKEGVRNIQNSGDNKLIYHYIIIFKIILKFRNENIRIKKNFTYII